MRVGRSATAREENTVHDIVVEPAEGDRLDRFLAEKLNLSRSRCAALVSQGQVTVDGRVPKKSEVVGPGQIIHVEVPPPEPLVAEPEAIPLDVVFEDEDLLVVNKQPGLVVHPAPGHPSGTMVNALLHHVRDLSGIGGRLRPGIVHRLDRDTSGLMVVAKGDRAHVALSEAIRKREVRRIYRTVVWGHFSEARFTVDAPIGRDPRDRKRMAVVAGGRRALTRFRVRERWTAAEYLDASLKTGRTHQIRVHLTHLGHPVVGDRTYGDAWERGMSGPARRWASELAKMAARQMLHASDLWFRHPRSGEEMRFHAPIPSDMATVVQWARDAHI